MKVVIDIETDGLDPKLVWVVVVRDVDTDETNIFRRPDTDSNERKRFLDFLNSGRITRIIGHNFISFDYLRVIRRFFPDAKLDPLSICDTLVCSRLFNYGVLGGHGLEAWGIRLGLVKPKIDNFQTADIEEIVHRCVEDTKINKALYKKLEKHIDHPIYQRALLTEHKMEFVCNDIQQCGFHFNRTEAERLRAEIEELLNQLDGDIRASFKPKVVPLRTITPKTTKSGTLSLVDFKWLAVDGSTPDLSPFSAGAPFTLITFEPFNPASPSQIVERLNQAGWKPFEKTKGHLECERDLKRERNKERRAELSARLAEYKVTGWKVNEENLDTLPETAPEAARKLAQRILLASRRSVLDEWLRAYNPATGRIHGRFNSIGAWTGRMSHQNPNQGNIPSDPDIKDKENPTPVEQFKLKYSKSLRALWGVPPKRRLIGVDADQIQLRIFAHYINDKVFTGALVNGDKEKKTDLHNLNAAVLGCDRNRAKTFIYAFLLGAGIDKVATILHTINKDAREKVNHFIENYPGLKTLKSTQIPKDAKVGYFVGLDGRLVPVPSEHHVLAGYLQNGEQIIMKEACLSWRAQLKKEGVPFWLVDFVHDEWQTETVDDDEVVEHIIRTQVKAIEDTGVSLNLRCPLAGQGSYYDGRPGGYNWAQTH